MLTATERLITFLSQLASQSCSRVDNKLHPLSHLEASSLASLGKHLSTKDIFYLGKLQIAASLRGGSNMVLRSPQTEGRQSSLGKDYFRNNMHLFCVPDMTYGPYPIRCIPKKLDLAIEIDLTWSRGFVSIESWVVFQILFLARPCSSVRFVFPKS
ncbi:hypothetical protein Tco_1146413 [Tanacetum coccineum]